MNSVITDQDKRNWIDGTFYRNAGREIARREIMQGQTLPNELISLYLLSISGQMQAAYVSAFLSLN